MTTILTIYGVASVVYISLLILSYHLEYPYRKIEEKIGEWGIYLLVVIFFIPIWVSNFIIWNFYDVESNELGKSETIKNK